MHARIARREVKVGLNRMCRALVRPRRDERRVQIARIPHIEPHRAQIRAHTTQPYPARVRAAHTTQPPPAWASDTVKVRVGRLADHGEQPEQPPAVRRAHEHLLCRRLRVRMGPAGMLCLWVCMQQRGRVLQRAGARVRVVVACAIPVPVAVLPE